MSQTNEHKGILLEVGTNEVEFLLFRLGDQPYGVNVTKVSQIVIFDPSKLVRLPNQPAGVKGVLDHRGETLTVVDLRNILEVAPPSKESKKPQLLLVTEFNKRKTAFLVDGVDRIERCTWEEFNSMDKNLGLETSSSVVGTVTLKDSIMILLDVESIMASIDPTMSVTYYEDRISKESTDARSELSVVFCEDSSVLQKILRQSLEKAGVKNIKSFITGADCLSYLETAAPNSIDVIISDIEMPEMDGLTLCKRLRQNQQYKEIPIIFFSSMINEQTARKCKTVGGNAWFSKPEIHLLVEQIDKLFQEKLKQ